MPAPPVLTEIDGFIDRFSFTLQEAAKSEMLTPIGSEAVNLASNDFAYANLREMLHIEIEQRRILERDVRSLERILLEFTGRSDQQFQELHKFQLHVSQSIHPEVKGDVEPAQGGTEGRLEPDRLCADSGPSDQGISETHRKDMDVNQDKQDLDVVEQRKCEAPEGEELTPETLDSNHDCTLTESLWDGGVFLYSKPVGFGCSTLSLIALLINIAMQLGFCIIVYVYMLEPSVTNETLDQLLKFRVGVAHDIFQSDKFTRQSMATQMCEDGGTDKMEKAAGQQGLLRGVEQFRDGGVQLTLLVQVCWLGSVFNDLLSQYHMANAVMHLPQGPKTVLIADDAEGLSTWFKCISRFRIAAFFLVVALPRFIIAVVLGVVGVLFLSTTESMGDLVLNAVALGFVFDLDELLFAIMVPPRLHVLVSTMQPLKSYPAINRPFVKSSLMMLCIACALSVITIYVTFPFHWRLKMASEILCGGVTDFVFAENAATGMLHVARTSAEAGEWTDREKAILQMARPRLEDKYDWGIDPELLRISQDSNERAMPTTGWEPTGKPFDNISESTQKAYGVLLDLAAYQTGDVSRTRACDDLSDEAPVRDYLSRQLGIPSFECEYILYNETLQSFCGQRNMTFLRALCSYRCGCSNDRLNYIFTGLFDSVHYGCPESCRTYWQLHKDMNAPWAIGKNVNTTALDIMPNLTDRSSYLELNGSESNETKYYDWVRRYFMGINDFMFARPGEAQRLQQQLSYIRGICEASEIEFELFPGYSPSDTSQSVFDVQGELELECAGTQEQVESMLTSALAQTWGCDFGLGAQAAQARRLKDKQRMLSSVQWRISYRCSALGLTTRAMFESFEGFVFNMMSAASDLGLSFDPGTLVVFEPTATATGDNCVPAEQYVEYAMKGGITISLLDGQWWIHPLLEHPRRLTGCQFLTSWEFEAISGMDLCSVGQFTSIRSVCPDECQCKPGMEECPTVAQR